MNVDYDFTLCALEGADSRFVEQQIYLNRQLLRLIDYFEKKAAKLGEKWRSQEMAENLLIGILRFYSCRYVSGGMLYQWRNWGSSLGEHEGREGFRRRLSEAVWIRILA